MARVCGGGPPRILNALQKQPLRLKGDPTSALEPLAIELDTKRTKTHSPTRISL